MPFNSGGGFNGGVSSVFLAALAPAPGVPEAVPSIVSAVRDWDIVEDIARTLDATGAFDLVRAGDPPERRGTGDVVARGAYVLPSGWIETNHDPEYLTRAGTYTLIIVSRDDDPYARDRQLDRLANVAANALTGQSYGGGQTVGRDSLLHRGTWADSDGAERRMTITGQYTYFVGNNSGHGTAD